MPTFWRYTIDHPELTPGPLRIHKRSAEQDAMRIHSLTHDTTLRVQRVKIAEPASIPPLPVYTVHWGTYKPKVVRAYLIRKNRSWSTLRDDRGRTWKENGLEHSWFDSAVQAVEYSVDSYAFGLTLAFREKDEHEIYFRRLQLVNLCRLLEKAQLEGDDIAEVPEY